MNACILRVSLIFCPEQIVLPIQLFDLVVNCIQRSDVRSHLFLRDLVELLFLEQSFQLFSERDELGVLRVKVVSKGFTGSTQSALEFVRQYQFFFSNLPEQEQNIFKSNIEQVCSIRV